MRQRGFTLKFFIALILSLPSVLFANPRGAATSSRVIAYFPVWATSPPQGLNHLTNLVYAFLHVSDEGTCELLPDMTDEGQALLEQFKTIKISNPNLRTTLAIGGADNSGNFSKVARSATSRKKFVSSCLQFVNDYGFDGLDIDWEYPTTSQQKSFVALLSDFRTALGSAKELSAAVPADETVSDQDIRGMSAQIDWFGVMAYDECDESAKETCHHSAFNADAVKAYLEGGARKDQILYGLAFYGYKWKVTSTDDDVGGKVKGKGAEVAYREIKEKYLSKGAYRLLDGEDPLIINDDTNEVISFDTPVSIGKKKDRASQLGLGGFLVWDLSEDDDQMSLLNAVTSP